MGRSVVEKLIGKPNAEADAFLGYEGYSWGSVRYQAGALKELEYYFQTRPVTVDEALRKVGLRQTSEPVDGAVSYYWRSDDSPFLVTCGLRISNAILWKNFDHESRQVLPGIQRIQLVFNKRVQRSLNESCRP